MSKSYPKICFTITSGRRFNLFVKTMGSFLDCCLDRDLIVRYICSDDRSSKEDLGRMKELYPFLEIYSSLRSGQAANLNNVFSKVDTDFFFHCEDDWLFVKKDNFLRKLFDITNSDNRLKNVTLRHWKCVYVKRNGVEYRMHVHFTKDRLAYNDPLVLRTDCMWYGYSLNPGLQHLPTVRQLGPYDEEFEKNNPKVPQYFDRPQAQKYMEMGLKRANLVENYVEHIGGDHPVRWME